MTWHRAGREGLAVIAAVLVLACGDKEGPSSTPGSIQVTVNPATLTLEQGSSGSVDASLTRVGGFSGAVTLEVTGLPAGVTVAITPAQLSGATATATIGATVAATVAPGTYTATIGATAQGVGKATVTYQLTVTGAPNYALTVSAAAVTIPAGGTGRAAVNIARTNFTGGVALALLNPPVGITGAFNPTPSTTNLSALTVNVAASVAAGSYPLTIQGTTTGPGVKTTTLTVTVTPPPSPGNNVEYKYCAAAAPTFFAYQDGSGAWQPVSGTSSGGVIRFAFNLTQGRGGVVAVFQSSSSSALARSAARNMGLARNGLREQFGVASARARTANLSAVADAYETEVLYGSTTELAQDGLDNCAQSVAGKSIMATVAGVTAGNFAILSLGNSTQIFIPGASPNPVMFGNVHDGLLDFVATRTVPGNAPNRAIVIRGLNIPDGGSLPSTVDFLGASAFAPATALVNITGGAGDDLEAYTELVTSNGGGLLWNDLDPSPLATRPWGGLSAGSMATGDYHGLVVFASPANNTDEFRVAIKYVGAVANQTIAFGPKLNAPSVSQVAAGVYPRLRFQGTLPAEYNKGISIDLLPRGPGVNYFEMLATSAYLTASGNGVAYDLTMPDLTGIAGFPAAARISGGANDVTVFGFGFTGPGVFNQQPTLGTEYRAALKITLTNVN